ncbi:MAG: hypothetical protein ACI4F7_08600 [Acutalibacteraceae bacterium]
MSELKHSARRSRKKLAVLLISLALLTLGVGTTAAFITVRTQNVENTFNPSHVTCEVTEDFDGKIKSKVNVTNTSDVSVYIRVKLISYRVNSEEEIIGGTADIPDFVCGEGWFKNEDGFYYYNKPVAPGEKPEADLTGDCEIELKEYTDADGGKQVIEVLAEAIQSEPEDAVRDNWNVTVAEDGTIS